MATVGAHGRDVTAAELDWASHPARAIGTADNPITFHDVLSALNPLQYVPVVGTIYRALTGDDPNPGLRTAVSMLTGALMGGPAGLITNIFGAIVEHLIPVEDIARTALGGPPVAGHAETASSPPVSPPPSAPAAPPAVAAQAMAAYDRADGWAQRLAWGGAQRG